MTRAHFWTPFFAALILGLLFWTSLPDHGTDVIQVLDSKTKAKGGSSGRGLHAPSDVPQSELRRHDLGAGLILGGRVIHLRAEVIGSQLIANLALGNGARVAALLHII